MINRENAGHFLTGNRELVEACLRDETGELPLAAAANACVDLGKLLAIVIGQATPREAGQKIGEAAGPLLLLIVESAVEHHRRLMQLQAKSAAAEVHTREIVQALRAFDGDAVGVSPELTAALARIAAGGPNRG